MKWPGGARFAFTFVDDTDNATVENVKPVYDLLTECGLRTTKTVRVYPPRDTFRGQSLEDASYLAFVRALQRRGFEIALHGVGSGAFTREEIRRGLEPPHTLYAPRSPTVVADRPSAKPKHKGIRKAPLVGRR